MSAEAGMTPDLVTMSAADLEQYRCPAPAEFPGLWPQSAKTTATGALSLGGRSVIDWVAQYPTPVFYLDMDHVQTTAQAFKTAFDEAFSAVNGMNGASVYFASKALLTGELVQCMTQAGLGIDTASTVELELTLRAGAQPQTVGLHGNNKTDAALRRAIDAGIARIVIDSPGEVDQVVAVAKEMGKKANVMIRLTTGVHAGGHDFIATAHEDQKFGLSLANGMALTTARAIAQAPELNFVGLHSHIGSQIHELTGFTVAAKKVLEFRKQLQGEGIQIDEVDLGGGYGIAYRGGDPAPLPPIEIAQALAKAVQEVAAELGTDIPHISVEPGRYLVGPAAITVYTVGAIKDVITDNGVRRYVSIDGGMSDNIRPALYGANYTALLANRQSTASLTACRVVGGHCESGDIVVRDVALPADLQRGDLLAVPATGAYGRAMASNYNMFLRPGVLGIRENQEARWLIRPETLTDLLALDGQALV